VSVEALVRIGRPVEAARSLRRWELERQDLAPQEQHGLMRVEALLAARAPESPSGLRVVGDVIGEFDRLGRRLDALQARLDLAVGLASVDRSQAIVTLREIVMQADEIGTVAYRGLAEQGLRALGVRTWRRGATGPEQALGRLSEREWEIARLVADGASNPEIAGRLFLSRKTVERHVSNILAKIGVRNRTELATRLGDMGPVHPDGGTSPMNEAAPAP
jgi:DNA-binding NarL/FixJ family response regulator